MIIIIIPVIVFIGAVDANVVDIDDVVVVCGGGGLLNDIVFTAAAVAAATFGVVIVVVMIGDSFAADVVRRCLSRRCVDST